MGFLNMIFPFQLVDSWVLAVNFQGWTLLINSYDVSRNPKFSLGKTRVFSPFFFASCIQQVMTTFFRKKSWEVFLERHHSNRKLGGGSSNIFYFHPYLGK